MNPAPPRILMSAYQCAPNQGSVSHIGWEWYSRTAQQMPVTLVTHIRNKIALEAAGAPLPGSEVIYIDTEWFAGRLYRFSKRIFPRSEHCVFLLTSLDFFVYDRQVLHTLRKQARRWDLVHLVTPVSPSAHSVLSRLGLPVVRGPLNGGLKTPPNFPEFMKADGAWAYPVRALSKPFAGIFKRRKNSSVTLVANQATHDALPKAEQSYVDRMLEIAVDADCYRPAPWPSPPSPYNPLQVLFVGRMVPAKALPLLFEAVRRVRQTHPVQLTLIGDGPMRESWHAKARELGIHARFLGARKPNEIAAELARAHVFCLPSIRESGGAVLLEAMSAARPVLAVNYGGPAEIVNDRIGRLVCADGPDSVIGGLEQGLLDVIAQPEPWRDRGVEGRRQVLLQHTWQQRINAGINIYSQFTGPLSPARTAV